jgi:hypothetical protein
MTGGMVVKGVGAAHYKSFALDEVNWPPRFCKLQLRLEDGTQLAFCDSRRFAKVRFLAGARLKGLGLGLGPGVPGRVRFTPNGCTGVGLGLGLGRTRRRGRFRAGMPVMS